MPPKILFIDSTHPILPEMLKQHGFEVDYFPELKKSDYLTLLPDYFGIIIRSKFRLDKDFLKHATNLKFIGRQGAGMENIDLIYAASRGVLCLNSPEGNRDALGEHALGMLISLFNHFRAADQQVRQGVWDREGNRGLEIKGKTIGIIGYGNMGSAFAQRLKGFECRIIAYDKYKSGFGNEWVEEVSMHELLTLADVVSLHIPLTEETTYLVDKDFINSFSKSFYLINTARGKNVKTADLVEALQSGKIVGACLDVLEYEDMNFEGMMSVDKPSFDSAQDDNDSAQDDNDSAQDDNDSAQDDNDSAQDDNLAQSPSRHFAQSPLRPIALTTLLSCENVLLTPHIAGFSAESKIKLAQILGEKIIQNFSNPA